ncbi:MAG TPA: sn-glycerol-3-phosphate ABC transporter ATP-binding protein UgpC [Anaeromyxobacter sp.]|nr:sn-glycerol-3-phosphate ABC transporter ATP-binding protein UgpC [Anaeromyxobacter sp.]
MASVKLSGIDKTFGESTRVLQGVNLEIQDGEFVVFVGPSGCGKSTLLRIIAGLEEATAGDVFIGDELANDIPPAKRGTAMVFQSYALYPHMTVAENMGFSLKLAGKPKDEIKAAVARAADILQIGPLLERTPRQLSGGQRQRVAIGRAIVRKPKVFLFDEPLSNLDAALRVQMRIELAKLHADLGSTMIYVTHDQVEAMTLGDRIVVLNGGNVEQVGSPLDLYDSPANLFVAGFMGSPKMNFLAAKTGAKQGNELTLSVGDAGQVRITTRADTPIPEGTLTLGLRPEHLVLCKPEEGLRAKVDLVEELGDSTVIYSALVGSKQLVAAKLQGHQRNGLKSGDEVGVRPVPGTSNLFDSAGKAIALR